MKNTKLIFLCVRRAELDAEAFASRLIDEVAPGILAAHAPESLCVSTVEEAQAEFPPYSGICEVVVADVSAHTEITRALDSICERIDAYVATDFVARDDLGDLERGRFDGVKAFYPIVRKDGTTKEQFQRHWRDVHVPKARRHHPGMKRYVQNVVTQRLSETGEDWDGFTEGYYPSEKDYTEKMFDSPEGLRVIMDDVAQFIGRVGTYRTIEYRIR